MDKLKPCPFCGGTELHIESFSGWGADVIICDDCLSTFSQREITCEDDLVAAWNRRADGWIEIKDDDESTKPKDYSAVNVVWVNRDPPSYYAHEKDVPQTGTAHYMDRERGWYWESPICYDMLSEYGDSITDRVAEGIEITHWMPLPEPPEVIK